MVATTEEFLDVVRKSGILEDGSLDSYLTGLSASGPVPGAPADVAERMVRDGILTDFQIKQFLKGKYLGLALGEYRVLDLVGVGGMSAVYLAQQRGQGQRVAIKVLPRSLAKDEQFFRRFLREASAGTKLKHPNIVQGYEAGREKDQHFFVMEYVQGVNLHDLVERNGPLPVHQATDYICQTAAGLEFAHRAGLVHRDIKPANLILADEGTVKILDMGLSLMLDGEGSVLTVDVLGTPDYMAPEQANDSHGVDHRADIYSLGATFCYLLTGKPPRGPLARGVDLKREMVEPKQLRTVRPDVPARLARSIVRMMAEHPARRHQTAAAVSADLSPQAQPPGQARRWGGLLGWLCGRT